MGKGAVPRSARPWSRAATAAARLFGPPTLAGLIGLVGLPGCSELEPCGPLELSDAATLRDVLTPGASPDVAPVLALSDHANVSVIRMIDGDLDTEHVTVRSSSNTHVRPDQIMLTASGRRLIYRVGSDMYSVEVEDIFSDLFDPDEVPREGFYGIDEIVGTLRDGDWIVYRTWAMNDPTTPGAPGHASDSELWAIYVGDEADLPEQQAANFRLGPGHDLRVVAMGHRHVVARELFDAETEALYLIPVAPDPASDELPWNTVGDALLLTTGASFERVLVTEGPIPNPGGVVYDQVPTDALVIATTGADADARTLLFTVADRSLVANFEGGVVTSRIARETISGIDAVSPDGSHLAYLTPDGGLALRDLEAGRSCMVRPAVGFEHKLAGFAADGTLYFESRERQRIYDNGKHRTKTVEHVYAYAPHSQDLSRLTRDEENHRLRAAPPARDGDAPWAVVAGNDGQAEVARAGLSSDVQRTNVEETSYLALARASGEGRGDLWTLQSRPRDQAEGDQLLISRVGPDGVIEELHDHHYSSSVCVSTSQATGWTTPWATRCSSSSSPQDFLNNGLPQTEQGP